MPGNQGMDPCMDHAWFMHGKRGDGELTFAKMGGIETVMNLVEEMCIDFKRCAGRTGSYCGDPGEERDLLRASYLRLEKVYKIGRKGMR